MSGGGGGGAGGGGELICLADLIEQNISEEIKRMRPTIADEHYMNSEQLADKLHITTRTLQKLRDERTIPFTSVCGKFLYPESGIYEVLRKNYRDFKTWKRR